MIIFIRILREANIFFFFFFFFCLLGPHPQHMEVPRLGGELELQLAAYQQPQQRQIRAVSATYTKAHGNVTFLTH